jgi:DNA-binding Lrp family transcriptional regulator
MGLYFVETTNPGSEMKITPADQQLLSILRENARASTAEIARRLRLSRSTVQSRIERLERDGVIAGYTVRVNDAAERGHLRAHIMITVLPKQMAAVVEALRAMPEVRGLHSVSGAFDLVAMGVVPTVSEMDELTDRIGALDGVGRTTSSIILSAKFER